MPLLEMPPVTTALGNKQIIFMTTPPAAEDGVPTLAEVNAGIAAACYVYGDFVVTPEQNTGEGPRKLCSKKQPTQLGLTNYPAVELQYSYMPQELGTPGADGNEVYEALTPGTQIYGAVIAGVDGRLSPLEEGTVADVYLFECGERRKGATGDGEFDELSVTQSLIVVGGEPVGEDLVLASGAAA